MGIMEEGRRGAGRTRGEGRKIYNSVKSIKKEEITAYISDYVDE